MSQGASVWMMVVVAVLAANLTFLNERLFLAGPRLAPKSVWWRLLELVVYAGLTFALGSTMEAAIGQRAPQGWEFYAAGGCLFLTLAFPGFVWRYLRRGGGQ